MSASASFKIIEVESLSAGGVTSTGGPDDPENIQTVYVEKKPGATLTVTAVANPGGEWPEGFPQWSGGGTVSSDRKHFAVSLDASGRYAISANCDNTKQINVVVMELVSVTRDRVYVSHRSSAANIEVPINNAQNKFIIKTNPEGCEKFVTMWMDRPGNGSISCDENDPSIWHYQPPVESRGDIVLAFNENFEPVQGIKVIVNAALDDGESILSSNFTLTTVFFCLGTQNADREKAWRYARWKYDISTSDLD